MKFILAGLMALASLIAEHKVTLPSGHAYDQQGNTQAGFTTIGNVLVFDGGGGMWDYDPELGGYTQGSTWHLLTACTESNEDGCFKWIYQLWRLQGGVWTQVSSGTLSY